ncbi:hypothetical protein L1787_07620 [Acuticoccus sp. M5D2P5]|uniref:hypothetical protein n=1 Tax=Acuticoccus kalidii TaxID=2910977 RepID=UPI001F381E13|nr:hypothetical protein [Acuticoccus kalidii]MCF3933278.1 hypothetical protein [Acuticoccus kalidii]
MKSVAPPGPWALIADSRDAHPATWQILRVEWADEARVLVVGAGPSRLPRIVGRQLVVTFGERAVLAAYQRTSADCVRGEAEAIAAAEEDRECALSRYREKMDAIWCVPAAAENDAARDPRVELHPAPAPYRGPA